MKWHQIETAPKDREIVLWVKDKFIDPRKKSAGYISQISKWSNGWMFYSCGEWEVIERDIIGGRTIATHWAEIPKKPNPPPGEYYDEKSKNGMLEQFKIPF